MRYGFELLRKRSSAGAETTLLNFLILLKTTNSAFETGNEI